MVPQSRLESTGHGLVPKWEGFEGEQDFLQLGILRETTEIREVAETLEARLRELAPAPASSGQPG
jgi:hypothetical protein